MSGLAGRRMKSVHVALMVLGVCAFVLWPIFLYTEAVEPAGVESKRNWKRMKKQNRRVVGCIPVYKGRVFLISTRRTRKLGFPKGGVEENETGYYAAGRETLEEAGVVGRIDKEPVLVLNRIAWYVLEVDRILGNWKEKSERFRFMMTPEDAITHSEVKGTSKLILKAVISKEVDTRGRDSRLGKPTITLPQDRRGGRG